MDILIVLTLLLIAGAMLLGKPLQITINHKFEQPTVPTQLTEDEAKENLAKQSMDAVLRSLQDIMGVGEDGNNN